MILEPHRAGRDQGEGDDRPPGTQPGPRRRRRRQALAAISIAVSMIWAGLAFRPSTSASASVAIALYQAGQPDTFRVQPLGASPATTFRHPELQGDGAIEGPVSVGRTVVVVRGDSVWTLASPRVRARLLAPGCGALPSDDAARIWVVSCGVPATVRAFDLAGRALSAAVHLPRGYGNPLSISANGVALLASSALPHPGVILWDSHSAREVGATDQLVTPVAPGLAVTQTAERPPDSTDLLDIGSQQSQRVAVPAGTTILAGRLSPDAKLIAVVITVAADQGSFDTELGVIDVRRQTMRVVASSSTADGYWQLQWTRTGDRLVAGDGQPRPGLIARISLFDLRRGKVQHLSVTGGPFTGFVVL